jgi:uncharacterized protein
VNGAFRSLLGLFWNRKERRLRAAWRLALHLFVTVFLMVFAAAVLQVLGMAGRLGSMDPEFTGIIVQIAALIGGGLFSFVVFDRRKWTEFKLTDSYLREFWLGGAIGAASMTWIFLAAYAGRWIEIERFGTTETIGLSAILASLLKWFAVMVLVGISEELFSRGLQLKNIAEGLRPLGVNASAFIAVVLSSLVFAGLHMANPNSGWLSTVNIAFAGMLLAVARLATGRLALAIGIHTTWNYFQGPVFGFAVSGVHTPGSLFVVRSTGPSWLTGGEFGPEAGLLGLLAVLINTAIVIYWYMFLTSHNPRTAFALATTRLVRFESRKRTPVPVLATTVESQPAVDGDNDESTMKN